MGALSGLSIKPNTEIGEIVSIIGYCDFVLIMSVEPGKSGQKFIEKTYGKVSEINKIKIDYGIRLKIEVDGGINPEISHRLKMLGANVIVSGSYVFSSENRQVAISSLR